MKYKAGILILILVVFAVLAVSQEKKQIKEAIPGEMVLLSGGEFWMGLHEELLSKVYEIGKLSGVEGIVEKVMRTEMPRHLVSIEPFYIDKYEVTNEEFASFVKQTSYKPEGNWARYYGPGMERRPAVGVNWNDANAYAGWAGKRLPTEAEWEFAARSGTDDMLFPWGDTISADKASCEFKERSSHSKIRTSKIGSYPPNLFGIHEMIGNAAEWCADWYDESYYSKTPGQNPSGPEKGREKVVRGGGWMTSPFFCRVSCRGSFKPDLSNQQIGFRCARSMEN